MPPRRSTTRLGADTCNAFVKEAAHNAETGLKFIDNPVSGKEITLYGSTFNKLIIQCMESHPGDAEMLRLIEAHNFTDIRESGMSLTELTSARRAYAQSRRNATANGASTSHASTSHASTSQTVVTNQQPLPVARSLLQEFAAAKPAVSPKKKGSFDRSPVPSASRELSSGKKTTLNSSCKELFYRDVSPEFTPVKNKLMKVCYNITNKDDRCAAINLDNYVAKLHDKYFMKQNTNWYLFLTDVKPGKELLHLMHMYDLYLKGLLVMYELRYVQNGDNYVVTRRDYIRINTDNPLLTRNLRQFYVTYDADMAIGPGVTRNFFQNALDQLMASKIFKRCTENSERYVLNMDVTSTELRELGVLSIGYKKTVDVDHSLYYQFVGEFLAFCMLTGIKMDVHLSRYLQQRILYTVDELRSEDYIIAYLLDFIEESKTDLKLMEKDIDPEMIADFGFEFANGKTVTKENYSKYLLERACTYLNTNAHTSSSIPKKEKDRRRKHDDAIRDILEGFYIDYKDMRRLGMNINTIDVLLTGSAIKKAEIEAIIQCTSDRMVNIFSQVHRSDDRADDAAYYNAHMKEVDTVIEWFHNILRDDGSKFPVHIAQANKELYPQDVESFKRALLFFFTSSRTYNSTFLYTLNPTVQTAIPIGHTCSRTLDLPLNSKKINSQEALYEFLVEHVGIREFSGVL